MRAATRATTAVYERPTPAPSAPAEVTEFGPYLVGDPLGTGGMATVHRAEQVGVAGFRRTIALKRLLPQFAVDDAQVAAFIQEARLASYLRHHNIAQTYDLG